MTHAATPQDNEPGLLNQHHFLLRRLHSLSGIMPVGVFVIFHLFTNAQMAWKAFGGPDFFQHEVSFIHSMPALLFLEVFGLWLPIGFHAVLGFWYTFTGKTNTKRYRYGGNFRYLLQRITGMIALLFILFHVATLRWRWDFGFLHTPFYFDAVMHGSPDRVVVQNATTKAPIGLSMATTSLAVQTNILVLAWYVIGSLSVVYHWSNGLWTAAISWGITLTKASQKRWGYICAAMALGLAASSITALVGAMVYQPTEAEIYAINVMKHADGYHFEGTREATDDGKLLPGVVGEPAETH